MLSIVEPPQKKKKRKMRMSKYVQSDIQNIYPLIKNDLLEGKKSYSPEHHAKLPVFVHFLVKII